MFITKLGEAPSFPYIDLLEFKDQQNVDKE